MAHLIDREVAGSVILQPAPGISGQTRASYSFHENLAVAQDWTPLPGPFVRSYSGDAPRQPASNGEICQEIYSKEPRRRGSIGANGASSYHLCTAKVAWPIGTPPLFPSTPRVEEPDEPDPLGRLVHFDERTASFHLQAGDAQYSFCVDKHGCLERLHFGTWVGTGADLTYLSESDPALTFEPSPAGVTYSTGELLRMLGDQQADSRQLWALSTHKALHQAEGEKGRDWLMLRVENITWRLRHKWNRMRREAGAEGDRPPDMSAEAILNLLGAASLHAGGLGQEPEPPQATGELEAMKKGGRQGEKCSKQYEFSEFGVGDFRSPSLNVRFCRDGSSLLPLVYRRHRIVSGVVPSASGLPVLGAKNPAGAQTLVVDMVDPYTELKVQLLFTVFPGLAAVSRRTIIRNTTRVGMGDVEIFKCVSAAMDFLTSDWHLLSLHGGWANERQAKVRRLQEGTVSLSSRRGVSSHQTNPFCVLSKGPPAEDHGHCYGFSLLYSGNWLMELEQSETGCVRMNAGLNPSGFSWVLRPQEVFETPECVCVFSDRGLGKMSRTFHQLYGERLVAPRWRELQCPVLINTWEAMYFEVHHDRIMDLARPAKSVGVELLVLDDGWFGRRDNDCSSLGDWKPDPRKLPRGLAGLAEDVNALGLQLGIWMEPEMVSADSELCKEHPEWVLHHPQRLRSEGRNQLVLDLTRAEVQDYIIASVSGVLSSANVEYVKWDMNRALTDAYSAALPASQQGEVFHRYVLGLYRIFETVTERFPRVLFESCASGGGRFDPALLAWCPQAWCSDNTDAFSRTRIQMGTSLWSPPRCMGAHITACPNHQTHRTVMMKTRFIASLMGTFGLELDIRKMSAQELDEVRELIVLRQHLAPVTLHGTFYRLPGFGYPGAAPGDSSGVGESNIYAWMAVSDDAKRAVVSALVFFRDTVGKFPSRLTLSGLNPDATYDVKEHLPTPLEEGVFNGIFQPAGPRYKHSRALRLTGAVLMGVGLPIHFNFDGDSLLLELVEVSPLLLSRGRF